MARAIRPRKGLTDNFSLVTGLFIETDFFATGCLPMLQMSALQKVEIDKPRVWPLGMYHSHWKVFSFTPVRGVKIIPRLKPWYNESISISFLISFKTSSYCWKNPEKPKNVPGEIWFCTGLNRAPGLVCGRFYPLPRNKALFCSFFFSG